MVNIVNQFTMVIGEETWKTGDESCQHIPQLSNIFFEAYALLFGLLFNGVRYLVVILHFTKHH